MGRVRTILAVLAAVLVLAASAAPAMASRGDDDFCFWDWTFELGWFLVCVDDDFDDGFDDGDRRGGGGNSGPG